MYGIFSIIMYGKFVTCDKIGVSELLQTGETEQRMIRTAAEWVIVSDYWLNTLYKT